MRLLFLSTRKAKPSFRFRVEQFLPAIRERGHECDVMFLERSAIGRFRQYRRLREYDVIFVQKRLLSRTELFFLRRRSHRLVYDIDDAVMLDGAGRAEGRRQTRFRAMTAAADLVICGNSYLADQARPFNDRLEIIPTCIDGELFHPRERPSASDMLTIGWTGSRSTNRYLNAVLPAIAGLPFPVQFKFLSDTPADVELDLLGNVPCQFVPWSPDVEISETATFDIGIMPLPDDPWTRGKCGFKALQYMGLSIAAVCSPVGVNCEIITHEENGLLAETTEDWIHCLDRLGRDADYRRAMGEAGRRRVEDYYTVQAQAPRLLECLERFAGPIKKSA